MGIIGRISTGCRMLRQGHQQDHGGCNDTAEMLGQGQILMFEFICINWMMLGNDIPYKRMYKSTSCIRRSLF